MGDEISVDFCTRITFPEPSPARLNSLKPIRGETKTKPDMAHRSRPSHSAAGHDWTSVDLGSAGSQGSRPQLQPAAPQPSFAAGQPASSQLFLVFCHTRDFPPTDVEVESSEEDDDGSKDVDDDGSEEEDEDEEPVQLEAFQKRRSSSRSTTTKKPDLARARAPVQPRAPAPARGLPMRTGLVIEKRRPKHPKNYKLQDYKKMSRKDYILARKADCFAQRKNATDPRFWSRVHQDIYESIILKHAILPQKSVNMEFIDSNSASFPGCVEIIDAMGLRGHFDSFSRLE
jgi:hypothetical protein